MPFPKAVERVGALFEGDDRPVPAVANVDRLECSTPILATTPVKLRHPTHRLISLERRVKKLSK